MYGCPMLCTDCRKSTMARISTA